MKRQEGQETLSASVQERTCQHPFWNSAFFLLVDACKRHHMHALQAPKHVRNTFC